MPDVRLLTTAEVAEVKAEWDEWRYNDSRMVPEVLIEAMDELILAADLLPQMAQALEYLEGADDMPDWVEEYVRAVLKPYRAALGTVEEAADGQ